MSDSPAPASSVSSTPSTTPQPKGQQPRSPKLFVAGLLCCTGLLALSNPNQATYVDFAAERLPKILKQDCKALTQEIKLGGLLSLPTHDLCHSSIQVADSLGRGLSKQAIDSLTERKNWGLLSLYETRGPGRKFTTLGIAGRLIMLHGR